jgi:GH25 family lysozyme M1 (1,4-beta-N-acetylmuramidase)
MKKFLLWFGVLLLAAALTFGLFCLYRYLYPAQPAPTEQEESSSEITEPEITTEPPVTEKKLTAADFTMENGFMTCSAMPSRLGIDVSTFQGDIDWQKVKEAGITFAIIRVGGRGYGEAGTLYADKRAQDNYKGAKEAGLEVGAYFFSQAVNETEAVEEAEYVLEQVKDWEITMPIVFDWEYISEEARTAYVEPQMLTDCMNAFSARIRQAGYQPMIYVNMDQAADSFYIEEVEDTALWLAMYNGWKENPYKVAMWQYTNTGSVPGISGNVDINLQLLYDEIA